MTDTVTDDMTDVGSGESTDRTDGVDEVADSDEVLDLAAELEEIRASLPSRVNEGAGDEEAGLARLVLTLLEFIREVLEHQAVRRMEKGGLRDEEVERLGLALMRLSERMDEMKEIFGIEDEELQLDLGPLGRLR